MEKSRRSAHHFIFSDHCGGKLVTKDEHDLYDPVKPFPDALYLLSMLDLMLVSGKFLEPEACVFAQEAGHSGKFLTQLRDSGILCVEKSRQMLVTWIVCAYLLWRAKYNAHQLIMVQSKREEDAANLVFSKEPSVARISYMESNLPKHLRTASFPFAGSYCKLYFPNGSQIWGIPEGGDIIRSNTPSVLFSDESAFQPQFGSAYTAALPAIKGGGQGIFVSTAEPGEYEELVEAKEEELINA